MKEFKSQKIKSVLKDQLKKKKITYEDLALELECSVPTVKRFLGAEELSLNRLFEICEILDIDLADLEALSKENLAKEEKFTEDQENFLSKNKNYFTYFMKLMSGKSPLEIAEEFKLNQRSTDKYLIGLEKLELIHVTGRQRVRPTFKRTPTFGNGPLARNYFNAFVSSANDFFKGIIIEGLNTRKGEKSQSPGNYSVLTLEVSKASYELWAEQQEKAMRDLQTLSNFESKSKDPKDLQHIVVANAHAFVKKDHAGLKALENIMGDIPNL